MTEQEIRLLMSEHTSLIMMCTQIWLAITSAFIVVAYAAGKELEPRLRKLVALLYLVFALSPLATWVITYNEIRQLGILLQSGTVSYIRPQGIFLLGRAFVLFQVLGFVAGTAGSLAYFHSTRPVNGT